MGCPGIALWPCNAYNLDVEECPKPCRPSETSDLTYERATFRRLYRGQSPRVGLERDQVALASRRRYHA
jgi:hypothetical protein